MVVLSDTARQKYPVDAGDENCWTALMEAAEKGWTNAVEALLNGKANPNIYDKEGWTALMAASEKGHLGIQGTVSRHAAHGALGFLG